MELVFESYQEFITDFSDFQESLHGPIPTHLRINSLKVDVQTAIAAMEAKGIRLKRVLPSDPTLILAPDLSLPGNLLEYFLGYIHPQALTSCLASLILGPQKDSYILDMCAAPGGKTSHMAQLMENTGLIVANELYPNRHVPLGHTLWRLGVSNSVITAYQAQQFPLRTRFDYVMADVPCSGEGTFRKTDARSVYRETPEKARLPELQKKIIVRAYELLKKGGQMLYSTCAYNPEENEEVISYLLERSDAQVLPISTDMIFEPGIEEWKGKRYDQRVRKTARFYPHRVNSVGFFMARIGKPE
ncbi:MAG: RsmB/NOP family class I SAM-dependent RNA methyltransferase [Deltaproteobacteria bacterium]|nr:RsmB/NOP family class I SAM-dependent RNA methyltransferase [Deltaproteobacteria bacterium]MBW1930850.1 RsmB/NOP family class I SAM-dependent RNA methyltransferase [Deltaproteobacteria bacterium]MBW2025611.1 RsmB/NOP family class I SAM-dependent RNA methyltransferase [Deltaproteobacteria bacterium]MBW2125518.1 RsmB/NOP family class I SAM-dependent RNA methyltransferase [Deltaproteobacteria bacterium]RLB24651.1 MAG: RsmB/NOP family class I SAM-dependent RNA methyltransferase [Deltaproteobacte